MFIEKTIEVNSGFLLNSYEAIPDSPEGVVLIIHGMAEHGARYLPFANYLKTKNWGCVAYDQRGHGKTSALNGQRGFIADKNGWDLLISDLDFLHKDLCIRFPYQSIVILGHSMGAILAASFVIKTKNKPSAVVLSALAFDPGILLPLGKGLSSFLALISGKNSPSKVMDKLTFGDFNSSFKNPRTPFDWLSRKEEEVDKYIQDPDCGEVFTHQFFRDMLSGLQLVHQGVSTWPKDLPTLMIMGQDDPVVGFKKKALVTLNKFKEASNEVTGISYPGGRHEMMNEVNRNEVYDDIFNWTKDA